MINYEISIIIPTFNRANFLKTCIDSCLAQTQKCEIIVCDHGSTDNTPGVAKSYGDKIKYVRRELDSGVHFCWLDGVLHAKNDFIHINYDDDWIGPTYIEECAKLISDNVGCVFTEVQLFDESNNEFGRTIFNLENQSGTFPIKKIKHFNLKYLTSPGAGVFRKQILLDSLFVGNIPFTKNHYHGVGPDILFSLMSTLNYSHYGFVNKPLAFFRVHENSITIDAQSNKTKSLKIKKAYEDAKIYFFIYKFISLFNIYNVAKLYYKIRKNFIKIKNNNND
ncbi:glycosyltransferase family 2 protein [Flavobacterium sp.]|jgi:glycosyltransferase involved in cell wall biosynthesis|uniref:glycosyltransferase family 2 protein n=1 Tax=Flavobacterium sp. TaxID=239 RepID=UPI0037C159D8